MAATADAVSTTATQTPGDQPASSPDYSGMTDEQLLGTALETQEKPSTAEAPAEPAKVEPGEGQKPAEETPTAQPEKLPEGVEEDGRAIPTKHRDYFKANTDVKNAWFVSKAYGELGSVQQLRELTEMFPGGVDYAKALLTENKEVAELDSKFIDGGAEGRAEVMDGIRESYPQAYEGFAREYPEFLKERSPELYNEVRSGMVRDLLSSDGNDVNAHVSAIIKAWNEGKAEDGAKLLSELQAWMAYYTGERKTAMPSKELQAFEKQRKDFDAERQSFQTQREQAHWVDIKQNFYTDAIEQTRKFLEGKLPEGLSRESANRLTGKVINHIQEVLGKNEHFMAPVNRAAQSGDIKDGAGRLKEAFRRLLPALGGRVLSEWTKDFLAVNNQTLTQKRSAGTRRDLGGGAQVSGTVKPESAKVDYSKMSDIEILTSP